MYQKGNDSRIFCPGFLCASAAPQRFQRAFQSSTVELLILFGDFGGVI